MWCMRADLYRLRWYAERPGRRAVFVHIRIRRAVGRWPWTSGARRLATTILGPPFSSVRKQKKITMLYPDTCKQKYRATRLDRSAVTILRRCRLRPRNTISAVDLYIYI